MFLLFRLDIYFNPFVDLLPSIDLLKEYNDTFCLPKIKQILAIVLETWNTPQACVAISIWRANERNICVVNICS